MHHETFQEKFIRILMANTRARGLLKEIVRVQNLLADSPEAVAEREAALSKLCQLAMGELDAPPVFVKMPPRRWFLWPILAHSQAK
ncbi:MAG: hypothetical protein ACRYFS_01115 [Janthinobacterium lividum]